MTTKELHWAENKSIRYYKILWPTPKTRSTKIYTATPWTTWSMHRHTPKLRNKKHQKNIKKTGRSLTCRLKLRMSPRSPIGKFGAPSLYRVRGLGLGSRDPAVHISIKSTFFRVEKRWRYWEAMVENHLINTTYGVVNTFLNIHYEKNRVSVSFGPHFSDPSPSRVRPFLEVWAYASHNSPMNLCNIFSTLISFHAENENPDLFDVTKDDLNHPIKLKLLLTSKSLFSFENSSSKSDFPFQSSDFLDFPTIQPVVFQVCCLFSLIFPYPLPPLFPPKKSHTGTAQWLNTVPLSSTCTVVPRDCLFSLLVLIQSLSPDWGWVEV